MPFSHHSHSGQFCPGHAVDDLEDIIKTAIAKDFKVFALTEHMPRGDEHRYPEEIEAGSTRESLFRNEESYVRTAIKLREIYGHQIHLPIGFEGEWCGQGSLELIERSLHKYQYDFFIGSLHHVRGIPIDYSKQEYDRAKAEVGGTDESLFHTYFDEQFAMLDAVRPPIVGHFDLIRLLSSNPDGDWQLMTTVWSKILRNLDFVASYGGILEINTAAWRKGMFEPYPKTEICQAFLARQGRFCLSDDSHGRAHIATNYDKLLPFLRKNNIDKLTYLTCVSHEDANSGDPRFPKLGFNSIHIADVSDHEVLKPM